MDSFTTPNDRIEDAIDLVGLFKLCYPDHEFSKGSTKAGKKCVQVCLVSMDMYTTIQSISFVPPLLFSPPFSFNILPPCPIGVL